MKQSGERYIVTWWALLVGAVAFLPLAVDARHALWPVVPYALASAVLQLLYYLILGFAYRRGDFSLVYPIARGSAPLFIALWSVLFLHEHVPWRGLVGLLVIVVGIAVIGAGAWCKDAQWQWSVGGLAPLLIALCISGYSVVDGAAVQQAPPLPYTVLGFALSVLLLTPFVWAKYGWAALLATGRTHWWQILLIGLCTYTAYGLVLMAYAFAPVSYVGAVREISIVFAALAGWLWLGEPFGINRTIGALFVCTGITILTVAG